MPPLTKISNWRILSSRWLHETEILGFNGGCCFIRKAMCSSYCTGMWAEYQLSNWCLVCRYNSILFTSGLWIINHWIAILFFVHIYKTKIYYRLRINFESFLLSKQFISAGLWLAGFASSKKGGTWDEYCLIITV